MALENDDRKRAFNAAILTWLESARAADEHAHQSFGWCVAGYRAVEIGHWGDIRVFESRALVGLLCPWGESIEVRARYD